MAVDLQWLLDKLCEDHGFCLPRREQDRILALTFDNADALTREVLISEGLDPEYDRRQYTTVLDAVQRYYFPPPEPDIAELQRQSSKPSRRRRGGRAR